MTENPNSRRFRQEHWQEENNQSIPVDVRQKFNLSEEYTNPLGFINDIKQTMMQTLPWTHNIINRDKIRRHFSASGVKTAFYMNAREDKVGERLHLTTRNWTFVLSRDFYNQLIKGRPGPFQKTRPKTCSIVGSSGILLNSRCGAQIDKADAVFRINSPRLKPFRNDAGRNSIIYYI
ncbi:alpha-N-acetylneuraminate alpha-2,8-sialyltransferase ST8SIA3-like [Glandiceps talaboti]